MPRTLKCLLIACSAAVICSSACALRMVDDKPGYTYHDGAYGPGEGENDDPPDSRDDPDVVDAEDVPEGDDPDDGCKPGREVAEELGLQFDVKLVSSLEGTAGALNETYFGQLSFEGFSSKEPVEFPATRFVPTDDAYKGAGFLFEELDMLHRAQLVASTQIYFQKGPQTASFFEKMVADRGGAATFHNIIGDELEVTMYNGDLFVKILGAMQAPAKILKSDAETCGGIIHTIDRVLVPPGFVSAATTA